MKSILNYVITIWNSLDFRSRWKESLISFLLGFLLCCLILTIEIKDVIQIISSLCVAFVTIFTFYKTHVSWGIKEVRVSQSITIFNGKSISFFLKNESLMPRTITSVHILVDNRYIIRIKSYKTPLVIKPYSYQLIELRYTYIEKELDEKSPLLGKRISYIISTPENVYIIDFRGRIIDKLSGSKYFLTQGNYEEVHAFQIIFNNNVISSCDRYGVVAESNGIKFYYLIHQSGHVDYSFPWRENIIPNKYLSDKDTLLKYLNSKISELKTLDFKIVQILDFKFYPKPKWAMKQDEAQI